MWARLAKLATRGTAKSAASSVAAPVRDLEASLERISRQEEQGDVRGALAAAIALLRATGDGRAGAAAMRLRHLAFQRAEHGRADWPPPAPDLFPGQGVPEIAASELNVQTLGAAIQHHGALIIRGFIGSELAADLRETVDRAIALSEQVRAGDLSAEGSAWYQRAPMSIDHEVNKSRVFTQMEGSAVLAGDSPRAFEILLDLYEKLGVFDAVEGYLGERPALSLAKTVLRRVPVTNGTDWHQDGAFLGAHIRVVNLWLALSDCGEDAPGLDMAPWRINEIVETGTNGSYFPWAVGPGTVAAICPPEKVLTPVFRAGDAMMFDHLFLHRTAVRPHMTKSRYALESWMFAPSTFPEENFPLVV